MGISACSHSHTNYYAQRILFSTNNDALFTPMTYYHPMLGWGSVLVFVQGTWVDHAYPSLWSKLLWLAYVCRYQRVNNGKFSRMSIQCPILWPRGDVTHLIRDWIYKQPPHPGTGRDSLCFAASGNVRAICLKHRFISQNLIISK